jgi:putative endonuclease
MGNYFVYILTNPAKSVLYVGMTNHLERRLTEHYQQRGHPKTFAGRYYCYQLLYYERLSTPGQAISREKEIKKWSRSKKVDLITSMNPQWRFLNTDIMDWPPAEEV